MRSVATPTNQSFRVCKVNLGTLKVATNQRTARTEGLAQTCRAILHCRTSYRGLKSMAEEPGGGPKNSTSGSVSLFKGKLSSPATSVWPAPTDRVAAVGAGLHAISMLWHVRGPMRMLRSGSLPTSKTVAQLYAKALPTKNGRAALCKSSADESKTVAAKEKCTKRCDRQCTLPEATTDAIDAE